MQQILSIYAHKPYQKQTEIQLSGVVTGAEELDSAPALWLGVPRAGHLATGPTPPTEE